MLDVTGGSIMRHFITVLALSAIGVVTLLVATTSTNAITQTQTEPGSGPGSDDRTWLTTPVQRHRWPGLDTEQQLVVQSAAQYVVRNHDQFRRTRNRNKSKRQQPAGSIAHRSYVLDRIDQARSVPQPSARVNAGQSGRSIVSA